jgi:hypothetical protein
MRLSLSFYTVISKTNKQDGEIPSKAMLSAKSWTMVLKGTFRLFSNKQQLFDVFFGHAT